MNWFTDTFKSIARGAGELSPSCRAAVRLQSDALDRPLALRQRLGLRMHLVLCRWCRRYGKQIKFLRAAAHDCVGHDALDTAAALPPEVRERIKRTLREQQG